MDLRNHQCESGEKRFEYTIEESIGKKCYEWLKALAKMILLEYKVHIREPAEVFMTPSSNILFKCLILFLILVF